MTSAANWIADLELQRQWIVSKDERELAKWLTGCLLRVTTFPILITGRDLSAPEALAMCLQVISEANAEVEGNARALIISAITRCVKSWTRSDDPSLHILTGLLVLVGTLEVLEAYNVLIWIAFTGLAKERPAVHRELLRSVLGQRPLSARATLVCKRDLAEPYYANICFRALCENKPTQAQRYVVSMVRHAVLSPELVHLDACLYFMVRTLGLEQALKDIERIYRSSLPLERRAVFRALYCLPQVEVCCDKDFQEDDEYRFRIMDPSGNPSIVVYIENASWITDEILMTRKHLWNARMNSLGDDVPNWVQV